jgi:pimeloyl-ACP methyl ester carboxylesterase
VAVNAALQDPTIAFVITISGPSTTMLDQFTFQHAMHFDGPALDDEQREAFIAFQDGLYNYLGTGVAGPNLETQYAAAQSEPWWLHFENWGFGGTMPSVDSLDSRSFEVFRKIQYDPYRSVFNATAPLLYIYGSQDVQTPVPESVERLKRITALRPSLDITVHEFNDMGHSMYMRDDDGNPIPLIREDIRAAINSWLKKFEAK